jgi:short-subunit dehydrogenase
MKAIVIGATSGIGRELAKQLAEAGYSVGITGRRTELLQTLATELPTKAVIRTMDVAKPEVAMSILEEMIAAMGAVDLIVINAGVGIVNPELDWSTEKQIIDVNVTGFVAMANIAMRYFIQQKRGHLVGISSIAALRGSRHAPAYNASKAFISSYMAGMRNKAAQLGLSIPVTDIQPGFVDTPMIAGNQTFWMASVEKAVSQIIDAIRKKRRQAYITKRWRLVAWVFQAVPGVIYDRL